MTTTPLSPEAIRALLHALNNQLGVVIGAIDLLEMDLNNAERAERMLAMAKEGATKMADLIKDYRETNKSSLY